ncbi:hypothetical protein ACLB2K_029027 [Fragaria x ananassa]
MEKLFSCCPMLEDLSIHGTHGRYGDEAVLNFTVSAPELKTLKGCCLPVFDKLRRLELALYNCYYWELLKVLLRRSPRLEYLVSELKDFMCPGASSDHQWSPPDSVPICLLTHLKTVSIWGFKGKPDEMDAAKYLLMKKMTVF